MLTFWRHGYETTSIADLTAAMGISPPSLYTAFGDKKQLFLEAVRLYVGELQVFARTIAEASSAYAAASELMTDAAIAYTGEETPRGCLLASATASGSMASAEVQQAVAEVRRSVQRCLQDRIAQDVTRGLLPSTAEPMQLSCLVMAVMNGMSVLARDGATRVVLLATVRAALRAWPGESR